MLFVESRRCTREAASGEEMKMRMITSRFRISVLAFMLGSVISIVAPWGCGSFQRTSAGETTTQPAPITFKLADAVDLRSVQKDNQQATFSDKLSPPHSVKKMYFGVLDTFAN